MEQNIITPVTSGAKSSGRNLNVTVAKGIGIMLMVIGHSGAPAFLYILIYEFHMPLFFILAGYCFKQSHLSHPWQFAKRRMKGLWWPFVKWNLLFMLVHNVLYSAHIVTDYYTWRDIWHRLGWMAVMTHSETMLGGFWFLCGLLVASLIGWGVLWVCRGKAHLVGWATLAIALVVSVCNIWVVSPNTGYKPTNFMLYVVFFLCGYLISAMTPKQQSVHTGRASWGLILSLSGTLVVIAWFFPFPYGVTTFFTWQLPIYVIGGVSGTLAVLALASRLQEGRLKRLLVFCGDSSMAILIWHFLCFKGVTAVLLHIHGMPVEEMTAFPVHSGFSDRFWVVYAIAGISLPLMLQAGYLIISNAVGPYIGRKLPFAMRK